MKPWVIREVLTDDHDLAAFTCGDADMDRWVADKALDYCARGLCVVWVCVDESGAVAGLFSLSSHSIEPGDVPRNQRGGINQMAHPAILLGRFALRSDLRGAGAGLELMYEVFQQCAWGAQSVGARHLVLDAKNESLAAYYAKMGFKPTPNDPLRMLIGMKAVIGLVRELNGPSVLTPEPTSPASAVGRLSEERLA